MCEDLDSESEMQTLLCSECENDVPSDPCTDAFLALINHHVGRGTRPQCDIAQMLGISRRQLGRMLSGRRPIRLGELKSLTDLLGIDRARATVAIEIIGDWQSYDDPGLSIAMGLLVPVVAKLRDRADFTIEPLTRPAQDKLSDWLADTIITNEQQIRNRRDSFVKLPDL
jgi:transcriptional regulator with XRE-family HTH domain